MPKEKERQLAYYYYVEKQMTAKEAADKAGTTESTMSKWVNKYGWKAEREARALTPAARAENIRNLISSLAEQRIAIARELDEAMAVRDTERIGELRRQMAAIDDGAAKWNKALDNARRESRIGLTTYLDVMERIFNALREFDMKTYLSTVEFQEQHIHDVSDKADRL